MAGGKFSEALLFGMTVRESANDGSDFTNPAADYRRLFLGEDGLLHVKDSSGTVSDPFTGGGSVATDAIWDAAGDLAVGTGANTAAKLSIGATNGMAVQRVSGSVAWALPPGYEFDYATTTSNTNITATTEATANTIVTGNAVTYDGSTAVWIEFFAPAGRPDTGASGRQLILWLYEDSSSIGEMGLFISPAAAGDNKPITCRVRLTPSNASHTYSVRGSVNAGTGIVSAGAGGAATFFPVYIRITKV